LVFLPAPFPLAFPPTTYTRSPFSPILATCPVHLILIDLIILIILDEEYKSRSSSYAGFSDLASPHPSSVQISLILDSHSPFIRKCVFSRRFGATTLHSHLLLSH
jgi:hypothetical protein